MNDNSEAGVWGPLRPDPSLMLEATERLLHDANRSLAAALAELAGERVAHKRAESALTEATAELAEVRESYARDRDAWAAERAAMLAPAESSAGADLNSDTR